MNKKQQDFYTLLAHYYDEIFPLDESRKKFADDFLPQKKISLLDTGCATATFLSYIEKSRPFPDRLIGIEPGADLLKIAETRCGDKVNFINCGMENISGYFETESLDYIFCLGNTLVHLDGPNAILTFFKSCFSLIKPGGNLVIQIINYDSLLGGNKIRSLPDIQTSNVLFKRAYTLSENKQHVIFSGTIMGKNGREHSACTNLFPLKKNVLCSLFRESGFSIPELYADFNLTEFSENSLAVVSICEKKL